MAERRSEIYSVQVGSDGAPLTGAQKSPPPSMPLKHKPTPPKVSGTGKKEKPKTSNSGKKSLKNVVKKLKQCLACPENAAPRNTLCHQCIHRKRSTGKVLCNPFCQAHAEYAQAGLDPRVSTKTAQLLLVALEKQRCNDCFRVGLTKITQHSQQP